MLLLFYFVWIVCLFLIVFEIYSWGFFCRFILRFNEGKMKLVMLFFYVIVLLVLVGKINKLIFYIVKYNLDIRLVGWKFDIERKCIFMGWKWV